MTHISTHACTRTHTSLYLCICDLYFYSCWGLLDQTNIKNKKLLLIVLSGKNKGYILYVLPITTTSGRLPLCVPQLWGLRGFPHVPPLVTRGRLISGHHLRRLTHWHEAPEIYT